MASMMSYRVRVKLTGEGVIPSRWGQDHVRHHKAKNLPYHSVLVSESVRALVHWLRPFLANSFVSTWMEVR
jgi:hypothetical protein